MLDLPEPQAGPGEVRIRVHAAAVNPTDTVLRSGARATELTDAPPYVPGMEAAGVLEQIGEGISTDLRIGEHVMAIVVPSGAHGAYAERIVVPAEFVVRVPAGATDAEAASLPMNALTAPGAGCARPDAGADRRGHRCGRRGRRLCHPTGQGGRSARDR